MSKPLIIIVAALFISACTPEPNTIELPYKCYYYEDGQPQEEWRCTIKEGNEIRPLTASEQKTLNLSIQNSMSMKGRAAE